MKFRLIFSAFAIIVAFGAYALKGGFSSSTEQPQQDTQPQQQQAAPAQNQDNGMSEFSINSKN